MKTTIRPVKGARVRFGGNAIGQVTGRGGLSEGVTMHDESRSAVLARVEEWMTHSRPGDHFTVTVRRES